MPRSGRFDQLPASLQTLRHDLTVTGLARMSGNSESKRLEHSPAGLDILCHASFFQATAEANQDVFAGSL